MRSAPKVAPATLKMHVCSHEGLGDGALSEMPMVIADNTEIGSLEFPWTRYKETVDEKFPVMTNMLTKGSLIIWDPFREMETSAIRLPILKFVTWICATGRNRMSAMSCETDFFSWSGKSLRMVSHSRPLMRKL